MKRLRSWHEKRASKIDCLSRTNPTARRHKWVACWCSEETVQNRWPVHVPFRRTIAITGWREKALISGNAGPVTRCMARLCSLRPLPAGKKASQQCHRNVRQEKIGCDEPHGTTAIEDHRNAADQKN